MKKRIPKNIRNRIRPTYLKLKALSVQIQKKIYNNPNNLFLNIGGCNFYKKYWRVLDYTTKDYPYIKPYIDYHHNLMCQDPFPFQNNTIDLVYSSHTFEHVTLNSAIRAFKEVYRCLKMKGGFRVVLPNIDLAYQAFISNDKAFFDRISPTRKAMSILKCFILWFNPEYLLYDEPEILFSKKLFDSELTPPCTMFDTINNYTQNIINRNKKLQTENAKHHVTWYNPQRLYKMLRTAGFSFVTESEPQQSLFPEMIGPEFDEKPHVSFIMEAIK